MNCIYCGNAISSSERNCTNCGQNNVNFIDPTLQPFQQPTQNNQGFANTAFGNNNNFSNTQTTTRTGTAAMVLGILSLFVAGLILGILALVFGLRDRKEMAAAGVPTGKAVAGIVLGIIGLVGWALIVVWMVSLL